MSRNEYHSLSAASLLKNAAVYCPSCKNCNPVGSHQESLNTNSLVTVMRRRIRWTRRRVRDEVDGMKKEVIAQVR